MINSPLQYEFSNYELSCSLWKYDAGYSCWFKTMSQTLNKIAQLSLLLTNSRFDNLVTHKL